MQMQFVGGGKIDTLGLNVQLVAEEMKKEKVRLILRGLQNVKNDAIEVRDFLAEKSFTKVGPFTLCNNVSSL